MRKKSAKTEAAVRAAVILEEHFATLPKQKESKARKDLHRLATIVSRRAPGKASRSQRSAENRRSIRSRAKTA
jgi:hypothetical protein